MTGNGVERPASQEERRSRPTSHQPAEQLDQRDGYGPPRPLEGIFKQVRELVEYANLYVEARKDMMRAAVRRVIWMAIAGIVAAVAGVTVIIVAVVYLLSGIAHGLGRLFGDQPWLGELTTAVVVFLVLLITAYIALRSISRKSRERIVKKYERRRQQQRERFGHSATERAKHVQRAP